MNKPIVTVKEKKYFVSSVSVVLKLNSGSLIHLRLAEKLDGTESKLSNEETFKQEFFQDICKEAEGSFEWGGQTIKFILVGYNSSEARTFELVGLVVKKDVIDWFNENNFKDKKQDYFIYQKSNGGNSWPWLNKVLGEKFEQPNLDFVDKIKFLFPDNACIWRYRDSNNFHFLNRTIAFASRHLPEVQGWCAFDADKPLRLILFEEKKQDNSIPKLDSTWNPSHLFLPNRYSWNRWLDRSCTLSRDLSINTGQEIALIKQLVSDGSNGEDGQKGKNFQAQNPTRLLFTPGTINIGDRNIFCHTVSYEFKLPAFEEKESPSVTMKIEMDYPEQQIGDNEVVSLRLFGKFQKWDKEKDEETKIKIAPPDLNNWGIIDEKNQSLKSGDDAVLYTQILSPTYSDKKYSGIYIKHEKDDEMIVDIHPCGIPLVLGSVQKYRPELEKADITLCGEKLAISVSSHNQSLDKSEAIILDNSEIKLNHGKKIFGQAQQKVDFLSQNIELGSSQIEINSGQTKINSSVNVSFPSPKIPTASANIPVNLGVGAVADGVANGAVTRGNNGAASGGSSSSSNNVNSSSSNSNQKRPHEGSDAEMPKKKQKQSASGGAGDGDDPRPPHRNHDKPEDYIDSDSGYETDTDDEWQPLNELQQRHNSLTSGGEAEYPFAQIPQTWNGTSYERHETPTGNFSVRRGRGNQPFIQSRKGDFNGERVGLDYNDFISGINQFISNNPSGYEDVSQYEEELAHRILELIQGNTTDDFSDLDDQARRSITHLIGITQVAEEHSSRTPGSANFAMAGLRSIADGTATFSEVFSGNNALYVPARQGGTQAMRDFMSGELVDGDAAQIAGNLSEEESESEARAYTEFKNSLRQGNEERSQAGESNQLDDVNTTQPTQQSSEILEWNRHFYTTGERHPSDTQRSDDELNKSVAKGKWKE
jgi:hypothetical protein